MSNNTVNPANGAGLVNTFIANANNSNNVSVSRGGGGGAVGGGGGGSWYEAMSKAWGATLDSQAARITDLSGQIGGGNDQPSSMVALTAESLRMQFISNNAATSQNSVGDSLKTLASRSG
ncbi:hypothetical protein K4L06_07930 [Lysobacter sp. BMK333-48F3]|uniref:hypothetical protein n=1 Tax=Lysobacter sp. BMK333-48F3 TaxID=2867962 RepID=UPI001C8C7995|nr:hypothetical protein [Lysobacter sp. BMK333-48F3]MBX9401240.1 hypothetical protein [Lysobacter sp. BMK333-48F3]